MKRRAVPPPAGYFIFLFLLLLATFSAYRVFFLAAYALPALDASSVREAFFSSLRLDLAAAALLVVPVVILSLPLLFGSGKAVFRFVPAAAGVFLFGLTFVVSVTSFIFYGERRKPLEEDFFEFMGADLIPGLLGAFDARPVVMTVSLLVLFLLLSLLLKLSLRILGRASGASSGTLKNALVFAVTLAVLVLLVRGPRAQPLRSGQVLRSEEVLVNHVASNPFYNIFVDGLASWLDRGDYLFYDEAAALEKTREILRAEGESFDHEPYPLLRTLPGGRESDRRNVIIVQLEGFSNGFIGYRRGEKEVTPFLNSLVRRSLYFPFFVQNVRFTHRALFVINSGFLDRATERSVLRGPEIRHSYSSLGRTLREQGYSLLYVEGGNAGYKEMKGFLEMEGYSVFDGPVMDAGGRYADIGDGKDAFGYHDEYALREAVERFRGSQ